MYAVPMNGGALVTQSVMYVYDQLVAKYGLHFRAWPFSIDANDGTLMSPIRIGHHPADRPVIFDDSGDRAPGCKKEARNEVKERNHIVYIQGQTKDTL